MKGYSKLFVMFLKIMQVGFLVMVIFAAFFSTSEFNIHMKVAQETRWNWFLGEGILSAECLTATDSLDNPIRGVFDYSKLQSKDISCIEFDRKFFLRFEDIHSGYIEMGDSSIVGDSHLKHFPAAITDGTDTVPTVVEVYMK